MNNPGVRLMLNRIPTGGGPNEKDCRFRSSYIIPGLRGIGREAKRRLVLLQVASQPTDLQNLPLADSRSSLLLASVPNFS
jgi:hypothetical protein